MKRLNVENLKSGMILGEDIYLKSGILLLGKNKVLTDNAIKQLHKVRVQSVAIEEKDEKPQAELDSDEIRKIKEEMEKELNCKFQNVSHNPHMIELKKVFLEFLQIERLK